MAREAAVTPTLGVVLMLALVTLLGAGLMYLVGPLVDDEIQRSPEVNMLKDTEARTVQVIAFHWTGGDLLWSDMDVKGCDVGDLSGPLQGGQKMVSCTGTVTVAHDPTNTIVWTAKFP